MNEWDAWIYLDGPEPAVITEAVALARAEEEGEVKEVSPLSEEEARGALAAGDGAHPGAASDRGRGEARGRGRGRGLLLYTGGARAGAAGGGGGANRRRDGSGGPAGRADDLSLRRNPAGAPSRPRVTPS